MLTELFLRNTQFGRNLFLVGGNISVADNLGIKARNYMWSAYIFQGLFAAIGGVVMMPRQFSASGNLALQGPMEVIPMVIVGGTSMAGGRGGALKTVGGVVLLKIIYNAMTMFSIPAPAAAVRQGPHSAGGHCERQIYGKKTRKSLTERNRSYEYSRSWRTSR